MTLICLIRFEEWSAALASRRLAVWWRLIWRSWATWAARTAQTRVRTAAATARWRAWSSTFASRPTSASRSRSRAVWHACVCNRLAWLTSNWRAWSWRSGMACASSIIMCWSWVFWYNCIMLVVVVCWALFMDRLLCWSWVFCRLCCLSVVVIVYGSTYIVSFSAWGSATLLFVIVVVEDDIIVFKWK